MSEASSKSLPKSHELDDSHDSLKDSDQDSQALENAKTAYEYTWRVFDSLVAGQARFVDRAHQMIIVHAVIFGGIAFGLSEYRNVLTMPSCPREYLIVSGILYFMSGVFLAFSLFSAIKCCQRCDVSHPATTKLAKCAESRALDNFRPDVLMRPLIINISKANARMLGDEGRRITWQNRLNSCFSIGFVLATMAIGSSVCARVVADLNHELPKGVQEMPEKNDDQQKQQNDKDNEIQDAINQIVDEPSQTRGDKIHYPTRSGEDE